MCAPCSPNSKSGDVKEDPQDTVLLIIRSQVELMHWVSCGTCHGTDGEGVLHGL